MGARSYLVPKDSMTVTDQKAYRMRALAAGIARAFEKKLGDPNDVPGYIVGGDPNTNVRIIESYLSAPQATFPASLSVREVQPNLDFGTGAVLDNWQSAALAIVGTAVSNFGGGIVAPVMNAVRLVVWYGVSLVSLPFAVNRLIFRSGGAAGNIQALFDLQTLFPLQEAVGYFSEPVIWDPSLTYAMQLLPSIATGVLAVVPIMNFLFEPSGQVQA